MLPATRPLAAGLVMLVTLLAGCGGESEPPRADPPSTTVPASTASTASTEVDATSTASARQPHILVLTATGSAKIDKFTYTLDDQVTERGSARLPWRQSVDVPADGRRHEWSLTVDYRQGSVELTAIFNGRVQTNSHGISTGTGTVSISGAVLG